MHQLDRIEDLLIRLQPLSAPEVVSRSEVNRLVCEMLLFMVERKKLEATRNFCSLSGLSLKESRAMLNNLFASVDGTER